MGGAARQFGVPFPSISFGTVATTLCREKFRHKFTSDSVLITINK